MSDPLPKEELDALAAELAPPRPNPDLMMCARALGLFGRVSEHDHRLAF